MPASLRSDYPIVPLLAGGAESGLACRFRRNTQHVTDRFDSIRSHYARAGFKISKTLNGYAEDHEFFAYTNAIECTVVQQIRFSYRRRVYSPAHILCEAIDAVDRIAL